MDTLSTNKRKCFKVKIFSSFSAIYIWRETDFIKWQVEAITAINTSEGSAGVHGDCKLS